jgi:hypothetical protein
MDIAPASTLMKWGGVGAHQGYPLYNNNNNNNNLAFCPKQVGVG